MNQLEAAKKKRLFLIGNGFDLSHHIPSSYNDFRKYLLQDIENFDHSKFFNEDDVWGDKWKIPQERLNSSHDGYEFDDQEVCGFIVTLIDITYGTENWSGSLEDQLAYINHDAFYQMGEDVIEDFDEEDGKEFHAYYNNQEIGMNIEALLEKIPTLFEEWAKTLENQCLVEPKDGFLELVSDPAYENLFINYNYTPVLERTYKINSNNIIHIHGSLDEAKLIPFQFGHSNPNPNYCEDPYCFGLYEHLNDVIDSLRKKASSAYETAQWDTFNKKLSGVEEIYVYGFSFSEADDPDLEKLAPFIKEPVEWFFYDYSHGEESEIKQINIRFEKAKRYFKSSIDKLNYFEPE